MKKQIIIIITLCFSLSIFGQGKRTNDEIPYIEIVGELSEANGWSKILGEWKSENNKIISEKESRHHDATGFDNFQYYRLYKVAFDSNLDYILVKAFTETGFKYPHLGTGFFIRNTKDFFILNKSEIEKLKFPDKIPVIVKLECMMVNKSFLGYQFDDEKLYIRKIINSKYVEKSKFDIKGNHQILFSGYVDKNKDLIQFVFAVDSNNDVPHGFPDFSYGVDVREKEFLSNEVLKTKYFETSFTSFLKLFGIK